MGDYNTKPSTLSKALRRLKIFRMRHHELLRLTEALTFKESYE